MMSYTAFFHPHQFFWLILVLLFFVTFFLYKGKKYKGAKITSMLLRLFYLIMIGTGIAMLAMRGFPFVYIVKGILAIALISFMEMILMKTKNDTANGKTMAYYWVLNIVTLVLVVLIGFKVITF